MSESIYRREKPRQAQRSQRMSRKFQNQDTSVQPATLSVWLKPVSHDSSEARRPEGPLPNLPRSSGDWGNSLSAFVFENLSGIGKRAFQLPRHLRDFI